MAYGYENWFTGGGTWDNRDGFYSFSPGGGPKGGLIEDDPNIGLNPFVVGSAAWNALHPNSVANPNPMTTSTNPAVQAVASIPIGRILVYVVLICLLVGVLRRAGANFDSPSPTKARRKSGSGKNGFAFNL